MSGSYRGPEDGRSAEYSIGPDTRPCHTGGRCSFTESALYSSIRIQGYRGLDPFRMRGLGRVNLLVGTNNCGKTSILECIQLLRSVGDPHVLSTIAGRRGEWAHTTDEDARVSLGSRAEPLNVSHLFANHELAGTISIEANRIGDSDPASPSDKVTVYIEDPGGSGPDAPSAEPEDDDGTARLDLRLEWSNAETEALSRAFVNGEGVLLWPRRPLRAHGGSSQAVQFIRTSGVKAGDVAQSYSGYVFTDKEEPIKQALRIVEPAIENIAPAVTHDQRLFDRDAPGGVVLKLRGVAGQVPIGSMGDGLWRMLGLAVSLTNARGGALLVDEIDTGLHYSVMEDMWRMISKQAAALSVQVFATTHSRDCYESLAAIAETDADGVTIQRIDRSRGEAVGFSREAVVAAAERNIEVR